MSDDNFNFTKMLEKMKEDNEGGRANFFFPKEPGIYRMRMLPPLQGENLFYYKRKIHWLQGNSVNCINQDLMDKKGEFHQAEPCKACDISKRLFKTSEEKTPERELAYEIRAQIRYMYRIIVRGEKERIPLFFESGKTIFDIFYSVLTNPDWGNILSPLNGRDFNLIKTGKGVRSKYDQSSPVPNQTPIYEDKELIKTLLIDDAPKLIYSSYIDFISEDEMKILVKRHTSDEASDEEEKMNKPDTNTAVAVPQTPTDIAAAYTGEDDSQQQNLDSEDIDNILTGFE